jgi:hypothetical protein
MSLKNLLVWCDAFNPILKTVYYRIRLKFDLRPILRPLPRTFVKLLLVYTNS